jgi:hypothetical protein
LTKPNAKFDYVVFVAANPMQEKLDRMKNVKQSMPADKEPKK